MAENETPVEEASTKRRRERAAPQGGDFRIVEVSKRPRMQMLLRREINEAGDECVTLEMFVQVPNHPNVFDWNHSEQVNFGEASSDALRSYIDTYSQEAAHAFYLRARAAAEKNFPRPE